MSEADAKPVESSDFDDDWVEKAEWMRFAGALQASWHPDGTLATLVLTPAPRTASEAISPTRQDKEPTTRDVARGAGSRLVALDRNR